VPAGFVFNATHDAGDNRRYNRLYRPSPTSASTRWIRCRAISRPRGVIDPRAAVVKLATRPADSKAVMYGPAKFTSDAARFVSPRIRKPS